jgi:hypothetical protein
MSRRIATILMLNVVLALGVVTTLVAQGPAPAPGAVKGKGKGGTPGKQVAARPGLFFKEAWKEHPGGAEMPLGQANVSNPDLELKSVCGTGEMLATGNDNSDANPTHTWNGTCETANMFTLRHKTKLANLGGQARVKVNMKTSGFHQLRLVVKTADGAWMVGDKTIGSPADWLITEFSISELRWMRLNAAKVTTTGNILATADLSAIDEIGFADLMPGSGHGPGGWADVATIEVYADSKARE